MSSGDPSINPYAASHVPPVLPVDGDTANAIFHQGKLLVLHKKAILPDRCVKSNEPTTERLKRKLIWHHPAIYLVILVNLLIYVIVSLIFRKTAVYQIPLAKRFKTKRIQFMLIAWSLIILSFIVLFAGLSLSGPNDPWAGIGALAFFVLLLTGILTGIFGCRIVYAKKIDEHFVWLGGTCEEFRQSFPPWPYR